MNGTLDVVREHVYPSFNSVTVKSSSFRSAVSSSSTVPVLGKLSIVNAYNQSMKKIYTHTNMFRKVSKQR